MPSHHAVLESGTRSARVQLFQAHHPITEWVADLRGNRWMCRLCADERWVEWRLRERHTNSQVHLRNRRSQAWEPPAPVPPQDINQALQDLMDSMGFGSVALPLPTPSLSTGFQQPTEHRAPAIQQPLHSPVEYVHDPEGLRLGLSADEIAVRAVRASLERISRGDTSPMDDSDSETEDERSEPDEDVASAAPLGLIRLSLAVVIHHADFFNAEFEDRPGIPRPRNYTADESQRREYFPWAEKLVSPRTLQSSRSY